MYNSVGSGDQSRVGQGTRINVLRSNSQQNGIQHSPAKQWGGSDSQPYSSGGGSYSQYPSAGGSYPDYSSGSGSYSQFSGNTSAPADDLSSQNYGGQFSSQPQSGVKLNARPGSTSYSRKKPVMRKIVTEGSELGEPGWIPKNKPPVHSQSRYMPATMRSPPVNRKQMAQNESSTQGAGAPPAWQGTLRPSGGPRSWEVHEQGYPDSVYGGTNSHTRGPSPPRDAFESHSNRFYQLVNENNDQMEQYMKSAHHGTAYPTGSQASTGGYDPSSSHY